MSLGDEISLNNTAPVAEANADSTPGMVEKIRTQALAEEQTARVEMTKADDAANKAPNDGFNVLASVALEALAPGAKSLLTGGEFVAMRAADKNPLETPATGAAPRAIDKSIVETTAIGQGFGHMRLRNFRRPRKVGNRQRYLEQPVIGPCRQLQAFRRLYEHGSGGPGKRGKPFNQLGIRMGIDQDARAFFSQRGIAFHLPRPRTLHPPPRGG